MLAQYVDFIARRFGGTLSGESPVPSHPKGVLYRIIVDLVIEKTSDEAFVMFMNPV